MTSECNYHLKFAYHEYHSLNWKGLLTVLVELEVKADEDWSAEVDAIGSVTFKCSSANVTSMLEALALMKELPICERWRLARLPSPDTGSSSCKNTLLRYLLGGTIISEVICSTVQFYWCSCQAVEAECVMAWCYSPTFTASMQSHHAGQNYKNAYNLGPF